MATKKTFEMHFDKINKDGYISFEQYKEKLDNLVFVCKPSSEEAKQLYDTYTMFWCEVGLVPGKKVTKDEFVNGLCQLRERELKRKASGEETTQSKACKAMFEVIDTNNDGTLSLEELTEFLKAWGEDQSLAEKEFKVIDTNKNGKIEIEEYLDYCFKYWWKGEEVV